MKKIEWNSVSGQPDHELPAGASYCVAIDQIVVQVKKGAEEVCYSLDSVETGSIIVNGAGAGNALRDGDGAGNALRDGDGAGKSTKKNNYHSRNNQSGGAQR